LVFYLAAGLLIGVAFVVAGVTVVQPAPVTIGARMLLLPGAVALWPLVLSRWLGHTQR
jgi:phosphoglycerol transferase MdoB-like AlkP superfamily enzyme